MLSQLQLDLRELSQEARKREPELKEVRVFSFWPLLVVFESNHCFLQASENASLLLRNLAEKHPDMSDQLRGTTLINQLALNQPFSALNEDLVSANPYIGYNLCCYMVSIQN